MFAEPGPQEVKVAVGWPGAPGKGVEITLRGRLLTEEWLEVRSVMLTVGGFKEEQRPRFRVVRNDRVIQARFDEAPLPGAGAPEVMGLTLDCQLTRSLPMPEALQIVLCAERPAPRQQLVKHDAEREDVAARVERLTCRLLGRHVGNCANDQTRSRVLRSSCVHRVCRRID
jgi:hypothetical protein